MPFSSSCLACSIRSGICWLLIVLLAARAFPAASRFSWLPLKDSSSLLSDFSSEANPSFSWLIS